MKTEPEQNEGGGKNAEMAALHRQHYKLLKRLAQVITDNEEDAEEAVSNAYVTLLEKDAPISELARHPKAYLVTCVINEAKRIAQERAAEAAQYADIADYDAAIPEAPKPAFDDEVLEKLRGILKKIDSRKLTMLTLYYGGGYTDAEVAEIMGMWTNWGAAKARERALKEIRKLMLSEGDEK